MYIVTVLDKQMKAINAHYVEEKPTADVQTDILHRYDDGEYVQVKEIANADDLVKLKAEELAAQQPIVQPVQDTTSPGTENVTQTVSPSEGGTI